MKRTHPQRGQFVKPAHKSSSHKVMPPRPPAYEPDERDDPLNQALEAAEQLIRNIVASGGEAPLRARLSRLLPPGGEGSP